MLLTNCVEPQHLNEFNRHKKIKKKYLRKIIKYTAITAATTTAKFIRTFILRT